MFASTPEKALRRGDVVEVRSADEILATLDEAGSLEGMPFMPEMLRYVGRQFTVSHRVEKICDTASGAVMRSRRMWNTVLLDDLRCDGSGHGGCQAGCRLYWKEAWLRPVEQETSTKSGVPPKMRSDAMETLQRIANAATKTMRDLDGEQTEAYRCQATEAPNASELLSRFDVRQYVREVKTENVPLLRVLEVLGRAAALRVLRAFRLRRRSVEPNPGDPVPWEKRLDLRPGELVQVRSREEIERTLDANGKTRGLKVDGEMMRYCGGVYRVRDRVDRIVDERTGRMIHISTDCVILENVVCSSQCSRWRWFCPRGIFPFWREVWLRRVAESPAARSDVEPASPEVSAPLARIGRSRGT